jgi:hypothetical protein
MVRCALKALCIFLPSFGTAMLTTQTSLVLGSELATYTLARLLKGAGSVALLFLCSECPFPAGCLLTPSPALNTI